MTALGVITMWIVGFVCGFIGGIIFLSSIHKDEKEMLKKGELL